MSAQGPARFASVARKVAAVHKFQKVAKSRKELLDENPFTVSAKESYDIAYNACKNKVDTIVKECRLENKRFRDHTFDLGQDASNCLYSGKFEKYAAWKDDLNKNHYSIKKIPQLLDDPVFIIEDSNLNEPKNVHYDRNVHNGRKKHRESRQPRGGGCRCQARLHGKTTSGESPVQSKRAGTCYFTAALATISNERCDYRKKICVTHDKDVGVYGFVFFRDGAWVSTVVDDQLVVVHEQKYELFFGKSTNPNETWVPLIEKAYAKLHYDYESLEGGVAGEAVEDLTGGVTTQILAEDILDIDKFWKETMLEVNQTVLLVANRNNNAPHIHEGETGLECHHSYSVLDAVEAEVDGQKERLVLLRNPWGHGEWNGRWSDGDSAWTAGWMRKLQHTFQNDGKFWMSYHDFLTHWDELDRTKLFDRKWSMAYKWIKYHVEHECKGRFRLEIKERAKTVIALQQPDDRYLISLGKHSGLILAFYVFKNGEKKKYLHRVRSTVKYARRSINAELVLDPGVYTIVPDVKREELMDDNETKDLSPDQKEFADLKKEYIKHEQGILQKRRGVDRFRIDSMDEMTRGGCPPLSENDWDKQVIGLLGIRVYSMDKNFVVSCEEEEDDDLIATGLRKQDPEDNTRAKANKSNTQNSGSLNNQGRNPAGGADAEPACGNSSNDSKVVSSGDDDYDMASLQSNPEDANDAEGKQTEESHLAQPRIMTPEEPPTPARPATYPLKKTAEHKNQEYHSHDSAKDQTKLDATEEKTISSRRSNGNLRHNDRPHSSTSRMKDTSSNSARGNESSSSESSTKLARQNLQLH